MFENLIHASDVEVESEYSNTVCSEIQLSVAKYLSTGVPLLKNARCWKTPGDESRKGEIHGRG